MNIAVLVIVAYLTNGTPLPNFFIVPLEQCSNTLALRYTRDFIVPTVPEGYSIQTPEETMVYACLPVPQGTPGPAMRPTLYPGLTEAHR
jgi:hypothetical protein